VTTTAAVTSAAATGGAGDPSAPSPPLILRFAEVREDQVALVGGKGLSLGLMRRAGLPVPDGFCVTTEGMRAFIRESPGLERRLDEIARQAVGGNLEMKESWAFLGETRQHIVGAPVPERVVAAVRAAYAALGGPGGAEATVAVRSSGAKEDMEGASFAGQYETFLNVRGEAALLDAIRRCWASVWRNRVLQYAAEKAGGVSADLAMCVVVQRLVAAEVAGVLFTMNPLSGRDREMLVESCFGLGEALVSGRVNADRYVVDARTLEVKSRDIAEKKLRVVPTETGVREEHVPEAEWRRPSLDDARLAALARIGGEVAAFYERPMDLEWAIERGGEVFLLQARPITRLTFPAGFGEWTTANFKDGGVASDVCTPFMASCYDEVFTTTMTHHWREIRLLPADRDVDWLLVAFAKPYWNVGEVKRCMLNVPGFIERDLDSDLGMAIAYEGKGIAVPFSLGIALRALPTLLAVRRLYKERLAAARAFVAPFLEEYERWDEVDVRALDDAALAKRYEELVNGLYRRTECAYFLTVYSLSMSKVDFKVVFDDANAAAGGQLSYLNLVLGLRDVAHLRPFQELWRMAEEERTLGKKGDLAAFVRRYRHHSTRELDITVPRWGEDPSFVEQIYEQYKAGVENGRDPVRQSENQRSIFEAERRKVDALLRWRPILKWKLLKGLRRIRDYTWWREEMRDCSIRAYWLVRKWTLEVGRRAVAKGVLERPDDAFLLEKDAVVALAKGALDPARARDDAAWARRYLKSFRKFENPNEIGSRAVFDEAKARGHVDPVTAAASGKPVRRAAKAAPGDSAGPSAQALQGVGGSPGRVRGKGRIVRRLEEGKKVEKGDVLVTVFTDPGWTPLLSLVSAIVTETGGLLSHAAVISREYGIPAVLAAAGASEKIHDGDEVIVDGAAGTVEIVARAGAQSGATAGS
jgi:pyruvate,water dikinase